MDKELVDDFKQFIAATVSQATAHLATKDQMNQGFAAADARVTDLQRHVDARFNDLSLTVSTIADAHAERLEDHDGRLRLIEDRAA